MESYVKKHGTHITYEVYVPGTWEEMSKERREGERRQTCRERELGGTQSRASVSARNGTLHEHAIQLIKTALKETAYRIARSMQAALPQVYLRQPYSVRLKVRPLELVRKSLETVVITSLLITRSTNQDHHPAAGTTRHKPRH